jgi:CRP-like cAMP-binding protein
VARAISKQPDDRFASGAEFADALSAIYAELDHCGSSLNADFKFRLARELRFFDDFADLELREFVEACDWQCVQSGARIIREGNMERSCYILVSGEAAVNKGEQRIGTLSRGSCFGEMGFLSRSARSATVRARGEATLLVAEVGAVASLSPAIQLRFNQCLVDTLVERLASTTERLSKFLIRAPG